MKGIERNAVMEHIYPITGLMRDPAPIKAAAQTDVVHITERGVGAYVFCSEEVFERRIEAAKEQALFERDMADAVREGLADYEAGRVYVGIDALRDDIEQRGVRRA